MYPSSEGAASLQDIASSPIEVGHKGTLNTSRIRFVVSAVEGDDITIKYQGSRQTWSGKKDDLLAHAKMDN